jgi:hypothetical protein
MLWSRPVSSNSRTTAALIHAPFQKQHSTGREK